MNRVAIAATISKQATRIFIEESDGSRTQAAPNRVRLRHLDKPENEWIWSAFSGPPGERRFGGRADLAEGVPANRRKQSNFRTLLVEAKFAHPQVNSQAWWGPTARPGCPIYAKSLTSV